MILIPLLVGMSGTAMALIRRFADLSGGASANQEMAVGDMSSSLQLTMIGVMVAMVGFFIFVFAMVRRVRTEKEGQA